MNLEWAFPIPRTHCGVGLGNGMLGALVWGGEQRLCVTVNRADLWDHRGGECLAEGMTYGRMKKAYDPGDRSKLQAVFAVGPRPPGLPRPRRLPLGRFEFELAADLRLERAVLECKRGRLHIHVRRQNSHALSTAVLSLCPDRNILDFEDSEGVFRSVCGRPSWEWVGDSLKDIGFARPERLKREGITGWVQALPEDPATAAVCRRTGDGWVLTVERGARPADAVDAAGAGIDRFLAARKQALEAHDAWWLEYWEQTPEIELPSDFFMRFMTYALYRFAGATHPASRLPAGLQGPWGEEYQLLPWSGDYHFNVNIQQIYTLAFAGNHLPHLMPLFDMLESEPYQRMMRHNARVLFGIEDGLLLTHAVDDLCFQCGGLSAGAVLDVACSGWTAQLYWLYYQYTLDTAFLRKRALPFMKGVMRVYEEMLEERDGRLSIPVSISAEYGTSFGNQNAGRDPSNQLSCIHMLAEALLKACDVLDIEARPAWRKIQRRTPPYTLVDAEEPRIGVWEGQDLEVCHRHHSHLACIYPFDSLGDLSPDMQKVIDNTVDHWILKGMGEWSEWCFPWAAIIQARLGFKEAPLALLKIWREVFINEGLMTVYLPRFRGLTAHRREGMLKPKASSEVMQLDGMMAGATAVYEMLVHCRRGAVRVFPAVSERWRDVSFKNIRVPGAFLVSAERRAGRTQSVTVNSLKSGTIRLQVDDRDNMNAVHEPGGEGLVSMPVEFTMSAGETVVLQAPSDRESEADQLKRQPCSGM